MSYYRVLGLEKEPFSSSPDPDFFYHSASHETALKRLEISIRLRRGLNLILGDVGTGKTTLSRTLLGAFRDEPDYIFHLILDPDYKSEQQFLFSLAKMLGLGLEAAPVPAYKEALEKYLFQKGVEENKTIVLLIDEAQKISRENLEVLRMFLNYETNEYKLLQLVIMAQAELLPRVARVHNFMDRVVLKYTINPLDEAETQDLIIFRLKKAGYRFEARLFTQPALRLIYQYTQGYPRRIALLCHDALEAIVMKERGVVDEDTIAELISQRQAYAR